MKKLILACLSGSLLVISCSKSDDPAPIADSYMTFAAGSSWNYQLTDNATPANSTAYTVGATGNDTTAAGKTYKIFTNSSGPNKYYNITGSDYYTLQVFPGGIIDTVLENLYLKTDAAVGANWNQSYNLTIAGVPVQFNVNNKIQEKGISRTVGTTTYNNVIHVVTTLSSPTVTLSGGTLTSDIHYYYAPKYGMIENTAVVDINVPLLSLTQHTDTRTTLTSSNIP